MKDHKRYTTHTTWCCSFINVIIQPASLKEGRKGQHDKSKSHQSSTNSHSHSHSHSQLKKNQESKKTQITNHHEQRILLLESHTAPNTDQRPSYIAFCYRNRSVRFPFVLRLARRDNTTRRVVTCARRALQDACTSDPLYPRNGSCKPPNVINRRCIRF